LALNFLESGNNLLGIPKQAIPKNKNKTTSAKVLIQVSMILTQEMEHSHLCMATFSNSSNHSALIRAMRPVKRLNTVPCAGVDIPKEKKEISSKRRHQIASKFFGRYNQDRKDRCNDKDNSSSWPGNALESRLEPSRMRERWNRHADKDESTTKIDNTESVLQIKKSFEDAGCSIDEDYVVHR
jgi:hypothetical protein